LTPSNGAGGVESTRVTVIHVTFNHDTSEVAIGCKDTPIALAQMMLFEAAQQLEMMRRQAAAMQVREQLLEQAKNQAIADALRNRR
jgi:hypothetical protein